VVGEAAFVGRADELGLLEASLAAAQSGQAQIILVEGEPGIGKTALLRQCVNGAPDMTVLWSSGDPTESGIAFGMIGQLLAGLPGPVRPMAAGAQGWDSAAAGAALLAGISAAEERLPALALVADDLHWADPPSAGALLFCLRRLIADPVLVLLAARPGELDHLGDSWARLLADTSRVRRVRLAGLSAASVRDLAAAAGRNLTAKSAARLQRHTGGNPLYVSTLLAERPDDVVRGADSILPAPRAYAAAVLARLARLPAPARQLVCAAAVAGVSCPIRLTAAMAGLTDGTTALDEVVASGLLEVRASAGDDELAFAHPLARAAVYESLSPAGRRRLHQAAAGLLPPPASFGHRVAAAAGGSDSELAAELADAAGRAEASGTPRQAARYLSWAARVDGDPGRGERSLFAAVRLTLTTGDFRGTGEYADAVAARPDSPWRRYTLLFLAMARGEFEHAATGLRALAEATAPGSDAALSGHCTAALAMAYATLGRDEDARHWAERSLAAGLPPSANVIALQALAWSYAKTGRIEESLRLLAGCDLERPEPFGFAAELLTIRGVARNWAGDLPGAVEDLTTAVRWQRSGPLTLGITNAYAALAEAEFRGGNWDAAATHLEVAISLGEDLDHPMFGAYAHCVAVYLSTLRDDRPSARAHVTAARDAACVSPSVEALAFAALAQAHEAWARADWPAVITVLQPLAAGDCGTAAHYPNLGLVRYRLAEAYAAEGRLAEAGALLDQAPAPPWGGITGADLARVHGLIWQRAGDPDKAAATFAAAMPRPGSRSLAGGLLALDYGRLLVQLRKRRAAAAVLLTGRSILADLGAVRLAGECDRVLLAAGVPPAAPRHGQEGRDRPEAPRLRALTAREQAVARLVAAGMTNRQAAAELYVSVKAVEYHLTSVFAKLGIRSRRQLAGLLSAAVPPGPP
jgi:DNA-binding CsgD family transcriptional regulator